MTGPLPKPKLGIVDRDTTTNLQAVRITLQRFDSGLVATWSELDHVTTCQIVPAVHLSVIGGWFVR